MRGLIHPHPASSYETIKKLAAPTNYWPCNEASGSSLADSGTGARTLTITGSPTMAVVGPGSVPGIQLSGSAQYATNGTSVTVPSDITFGCWAYRSATGYQNVMTISTSGNPLPVGIDTFGDKWRFVLTGNSGGVNYILAAATATIVNNVWTHVCGTFATSGTLATLYVNGVSVATSTTTTGTRDTGGQQFWLGRYNATNTNYFNGRLAQVFWAPTAATGAQVAAIYLAGLS